MERTRLVRLFGAAVLAAGAIALVCGMLGESSRAVAQSLCDGAISDPSQPIEVSVGQPVVIQLAANATTGYEWLLSLPPDPTVAQTVSAQYVAPQPSNPPIAGQGGEQCWVFLAVGAGDTTIGFDYRRPFELFAPPAQSVSFSVTVDPAE
jgi:inhibitor of cysteine peptidase